MACFAPITPAGIVGPRTCPPRRWTLSACSTSTTIFVRYPVHIADTDLCSLAWHIWGEDRGSHRERRQCACVRRPVGLQHHLGGGGAECGLWGFIYYYVCIV